MESDDQKLNTMEDLDALILGCEEAGDLLFTAWENLSDHDDFLLKNKDLKLDVDKLAEDKILQKIKPYYASCYTEESGWIGEEDTNHVLIDGLDGTVNFANNIPIFSVSAAIMNGPMPVAGVVVVPLNQKTFSRRAGCPLLVNRKHKKLIKRNKHCSESLLLSAITPTFFDGHSASGHCSYLQKFGKVRMIGSAAWSIAMLAEGNIDAVYFPNIYKWDIMGGVALLDHDDFDIRITANANDNDLCTLYAQGRWIID